MSQRFHGPSDLHLHSLRSDGTEPPAGVVADSVRQGLRTIALTDHDTIDGWGDAATACASAGITFIPGIEVSARQGWRSVHILAYLPDPADAALRTELDRVRADRLSRAERIVRNLGRDYELSWDDVLAQTDPGATVGRPHIADALVARGLARDRSQAFAELLHPRAGYIEPHAAPDPRTAIELITDAGGVPILAHPATIGRERMLPLDVIEDLIDAGLAGFELGHRENTAEGVAVLTEIAQRRSLILTGSSDYHGTGKPNIPGEFTTSDEMVARIIDAASGCEPVYPV